MNRKGGERQRAWGDGKDWERGEMIGQGSFGSVFMAFCNKPIGDLNLNEMPPVMAVKSAPLASSGSIQHEADVLSRLKGSGFIVQYLGEEITTADDGHEEIFNLMLEFVAGGTLDDLIRRYGDHGLPIDDVRRYTRSILEGINHVHNLNYIHCDLKPENILLMPNGSTSFVAKVADLGLAKTTHDHVDGWRGTPMYTDPDALIDHVQKQCSDIWSLGAIVLEMLTGKPPWDVKPGSTLDDFLDMVASQIKPKLPAEIPSAAMDFLNRCLAVHSWERPTAAKLLRHPFVAPPHVFEPGHTKVEARISSLAGLLPKPFPHTSSSTALRIQPPPPCFEIPAGL